MKTFSPVFLVLALAMTFTGCSSSKNLMGNLTSSPWVLSSLLGSTDLSEYSAGVPALNFEDNGKVAGFTGCNNFAGKFNLSGFGLKIDPGAMTKKMCPGSGEQTFLDAISKVTTAGIDKDKLTLTDGLNELMTFARKR